MCYHQNRIALKAGEQMPFKIVRGDILEINCDVLVNPTDEHLSGSGGLDMLVHQRAGKMMDLICRDLAPIRPGQAVCVEGYNLGCNYVIHTAAPWYIGLESNFDELRMCYRNSLLSAEKLRQNSVAFPLIGSGLRAFPKEDVLKVAAEEISAFLRENDHMNVYLVVHDMSQYQPDRKLIDELESFIGRDFIAEDFTIPKACCCCPAFEPDSDIKLDESFSAMVLRKIDEKGMSDPECYHKANVDRRVFSKLRSNDNYKPKKTTAVAFAIALELDIDECRELLDKAGFSLSRSLLFDQIVEYCILNKIYDVFVINGLLFKYDQSQLN